MEKRIVIIIFVFISIIVKAQDFKVIVNNENPLMSLTTKEVSDLFLKKTTKWSTTSIQVLPLDQPVNSPIRAKFSDAIHGKSVNAIQSYWQQYVFAGKGSPALEKKSDDEVLDYVSKNIGAIGYVSSKANTTNVKVIETK